MRGDAETGTKNWELRRVPLIPDARALFQRMRSERRRRTTGREGVRAFVSARRRLIARAKRSERIASRITTCGICSQRAASKAAWIFRPFPAGFGHKDGGALAMKTYGHLRREHSIAQAQRVTFAAITANAPDVIPFPATA